MDIYYFIKCSVLGTSDTNGINTIPAFKKFLILLDKVIHAYNPSMQEDEKGGL
jgi:hypothetical protein